MDLNLIASWGVLFLGIGLSLLGLKIDFIREENKLLLYNGIVSFIISILGFLLILFFGEFISFK